MKKIEKLERALDLGATVISASAFVVMIVVISANVICRYIFKTSINWAEEVAYLCFNWVVFFGVAIVYRYQGLTAIDLVVDRLHGKVKQVVLLLGYFLVTLINIGLIVWGVQFSFSAWERKSPVLRIPYFFFDIAIPLAAVLLLFYSLKFFVLTIQGKTAESTAFENRV